jgi:antitoxin component of MazEF toxin-antitoxin module
MMEKFLKVCNLPQGSGYVPGLNIRGEYMKKFGFSTGDFVKVNISENRIVIEKTEAAAELSGMVKKNPALNRLIEGFDLIPV